MAAYSRLRRVTDRVCASLGKRFGISRAQLPDHRAEVLEPRMLMSVNAAISGPSPVTQGDAYVLSLTASSTASTYTVNNWAISYGDGTTHTLFGDSVADLTTYQNSGTYDITASVLDTEAGVSYSASATMSVVVDEATPTLSLSPGDGPVVGQPFDMWEGLDDGGEHTLSSMFIAWGDSTSDSDSTLPQTITGGYADDFSHSYSAVGTYTAIGTAVTEQGTVTATLRSLPGRQLRQHERTRTV